MDCTSIVSSRYGAGTVHIYDSQEKQGFMTDIHWYTFWLNITLALAGLAIYTLWKVRGHLEHFSCAIFFKRNRMFWAWAFSLQLIFALLLVLAPEASGAIKSITGIDLSEPMAFVTSGAVLGAAATRAVKAGVKNKGTLVS